MKQRFYDFFLKYKHALYLIYFPIMVWQFNLLEIRNTYVDVWVSSWLDKYIPYVNWFVIPYILWFPFVGIIITIMGFRDKKEFFRLLTSLYIGMTICNIIYFIIPNGQPLRVALTASDGNIFDHLVYRIYMGDTPTNCTPSIHVLFSVAVNIAILKSKVFKNNIFAKACLTFTSLSIILSTMFIKQHSIVDVVMALALSSVIYVLVYKIDWESVYYRLREKRAEIPTKF